MRRLVSAARWLIVVLPLIPIALGLTGVVTARTAVVLGLSIEVALIGVVVGEAVALRGVYRRGRGDGLGRGAAAMRAIDTVLPPPVGFLLRHDIGIMQALWLAARRRRSVPAGATALPYGSEFRFVLYVVTIGSVFELLVVHFLIPWPVVKWIVFAVSVYGICWTVGLSAATVTRPHTVGADELRVRFGYLADVAVPMDLIEEVRANRRDDERGIAKIRDSALTVASGGATDVAVRLREPYRVSLRPGRSGHIRELRFPADEPAAAVTAIRARQAAKMRSPDQ